MADRKITELSAMSAGGQATGDLLTIVDVSEAAAADKNKKITVENLFKGIPSDVGIGTASPGSYATGFNDLVVGNHTGNHGITIASENNSTGRILFADGTGATEVDVGEILYNHANNSLSISTNRSTAATIDSSGNFLIGKTSAAISSEGHELRNGNFASHTVSGGSCLRLNRLADDGDLIQFFQATVQEGSISVSGTTVSYNGAHLSRWSQPASGAEFTDVLRGSVLSNTDEMCEWAHAAQDAVLYTAEDELPEGVSVGDVKTPAADAYTENNEQLNRMKVSDVEGDVNVAGVFQAWDDDDDTYTNDFYCAMTGDFIIRIAQGTTVSRGDLLMSAGDGTAKPQDDDIVRSKTIAKVTSTTVSTTYADGSYCVPCVLMAC